MVTGVQYIDMEAQNTSFDTRNVCPQCGANTHVVRLGGEPPREICTCHQWDGVTLQ